MYIHNYKNGEVQVQSKNTKKFLSERMNFSEKYKILIFLEFPDPM